MSSKPITMRVALVLLLAALTAGVAGWLLHLEVRSLPLAVLTGGGAFAGAWTFFDRLID